MVEEWPYKVGFSLEHFQSVLVDNELLNSYLHSVWMAVCTALLGTLLAYGAALITARSTFSNFYKRTIDSISVVTNAIPGMVLGVAYMFLFPGTPLQNTLILMILCNIVHYFSTPYLMMKNSLPKMNASWETTAMLMGDSWFKTILQRRHTQYIVQPFRGVQLLFYQCNGHHQRAGLHFWSADDGADYQNQTAAVHQ